MTPPDTLPAAVGLPIAFAATLGWLWPTIVTRIPLPWRERFTRHRWVGGYVRHCTAHVRCRGRLRRYNDRGVRLCEAWSPLLPEDVGLMKRGCDLYHGHPLPHFNIASDRTWR